jgi:uridine kinase
MIGDKLVITDYHRNAAAKALPVVKDRLKSNSGPIAVSVAGESGSGKSEIAYCLKELLEKEGLSAFIFGQDDYFKLPPKSNHNKRLEDIGWVGPTEVKLDLLDEHIQLLKINSGIPLNKPLVYFDDDRIDEESVEPKKWDVVIAEGTYTSLLENLDVRVFINRNYRQTKKARLTRGRDPDVKFLEDVLKIEHKEISTHLTLADVVIDPPPEERE